MQYRKRVQLSLKEILMLLGIGAAAVTVMGALVAADIRISRSIKGGGAFFNAWEGARVFLWEHGDPYSASTSRLAQELAYGRAARPEENPYMLNLPFLLLPAYFPVALISDPDVARGLWMGLSQAALIGTAFVSLKVIEWQPSRPLLVLYAMLLAFGFYSVVAVLEGTPVIMLGLLFSGILWAYLTERDELAGSFMALSLFAWEAGAAFLLLVVWRVFHDQRWRVLAGFGMTLIVLTSISFLLFPGWILPFLTATLAMIRAEFGVTLASILGGISSEQGVRIAQGVALLGLILLIFEWASGREADLRRFVWICCLALAIMPLLGFRTEMSNLVLLHPAMCLICAALVERWPTGGRLAGILLFFVLVVPWVLFGRWFFLHQQRDYDYLFLSYPLVSIAGLYWTRWWFVRPRRTWLDQVRTAAR